MSISSNITQGLAAATLVVGFAAAPDDAKACGGPCPAPAEPPVHTITPAPAPVAPAPAPAPVITEATATSTSGAHAATGAVTANPTATANPVATATIAPGAVTASPTATAATGAVTANPTATAATGPVSATAGPSSAAASTAPVTASTGPISFSSKYQEAANAVPMTLITSQNCGSGFGVAGGTRDFTLGVQGSKPEVTCIDKQTLIALTDLGLRANDRFTMAAGIAGLRNLIPALEAGSKIVVDNAYKSCAIRASQMTAMLLTQPLDCSKFDNITYISGVIPGFQPITLPPQEKPAPAQEKTADAPKTDPQKAASKSKGKGSGKGGRCTAALAKANEDNAKVTAELASTKTQLSACLTRSPEPAPAK